MTLGGRTILVVEDELLIALDLEMLLEDEGARVRVADAVESALREIEAMNGNGGLPDVAVLDVRLLDGEVFPVADVLSDLGVPIVFHSGHARAADLTESYPQASVLTKPAPPERLVTTVAGRLEAV